MSSVRNRATNKSERAKEGDKRAALTAPRECFPKISLQDEAS